MKDKITRFLGKPYPRNDSDSALRHLLDPLAKQLENAEKDIIRVGMSHYIDFASSGVFPRSVTEDLDRISSLYDIKRIIERVEDDGSRNDGEMLQEHHQFLERYRKRVKETVSIFLGGLSTARAIAQTVAAVFGLDIVENGIVLPGQSNPDLGIEAKPDTTVAVMQRPGRLEETFVLEITDNPLRKRTQRVLDQEASHPFTLMHRGLSESNPRISISSGRDPDKVIGRFGTAGYGTHCFDTQKELKYPVISNDTIGQMVIFNGTIPVNMNLTIEYDESNTCFAARIGQEDVSEKLIFVTGDCFDRDSFDNACFSHVTWYPAKEDMPRGAFNETNYDESIFGFTDPDSVLGKFLVPGENRWSYASLSAPFDPMTGIEGLRFDYSPGMLPSEIRFDWEENARAAFGVRTPRGLGFLSKAKERKLFKDTIDMIKAAGVEPIYDFQDKFTVCHDDVSDLLDIVFNPARRSESHEHEDLMSINGRFDRTRFDESVFAMASSSEYQDHGDQMSINGLLDRTLFGESVFALNSAAESHEHEDLVTINGRLDRTRFDESVFAMASSSEYQDHGDQMSINGLLDRTLFGKSVFN